MAAGKENAPTQAQPAHPSPPRTKLTLSHSSAPLPASLSPYEKLVLQPKPSLAAAVGGVPGAGSGFAAGTPGKVSVDSRTAKQWTAIQQWMCREKSASASASASARDLHATQAVLRSQQTLAEANALAAKTPLKAETLRLLATTPSTQDKVGKAQPLARAESAASAVTTGTTSSSSSNSSTSGVGSGAGGRVQFAAAVTYFGRVGVGSLSRASVTLINHSDRPTVLQLSDPALPFVLLHTHVTVPAFASVEVPLRFVPIATKEFSAELVAADEHGGRIRALLHGSAEKAAAAIGVI